MAAFDPDKMDALASYRMLIGCVVPRPIAWVSTRSVDGIDNLAPFSFFTAVSRTPPMISITVEPRSDGAIADTLVNLRATQELVVNLVSLPQLEAMHRTSFEYASDIDEFAVAGLGKTASEIVKPLRVAGAPVSMECRVHDIMPMGEVGGHLVIARVVRFHIADGLLLDGNRIDVASLQAVGRLAAQYTVADDVFSPGSRRTAAS